MLLSAGCALPASNIPFSPKTTAQPPQAQLLHIRFKRWSKPIYSGLLGIRRKGNSLQYVLLDGSGVTLAQANVQHDGSYSELKAVPKIQESSLPDFLASALQRIFLLEPSTKPCSRNFLIKFCKKEDAIQNRKFMSFGPFKVFDILYKKVNRGNIGVEIIFSKPWFGVQMTLSPLKN